MRYTWYGAFSSLTILSILSFVSSTPVAENISGVKNSPAVKGASCGGKACSLPSFKDKSNDAQIVKRLNNPITAIDCSTVLYDLLADDTEGAVAADKVEESYPDEENVIDEQSDRETTNLRDEENNPDKEKDENEGTNPGEGKYENEGTNPDEGKDENEGTNPDEGKGENEGNGLEESNNEDENNDSDKENVETPRRTNEFNLNINGNFKTDLNFGGKNNKKSIPAKNSKPKSNKNKPNKKNPPKTQKNPPKTHKNPPKTHNPKPPARKMVKPKPRSNQRHKKIG